MWFHSLLASWQSGVWRSRRPQPRPARRGTRLTVERLEDRSLPSAYTAASVSDLIADINAANTAGGTNTITLTAPTTSPYVLTAGQLALAANDDLTIVGNGDTIEAQQPLKGLSFRLLDVASGASLTLENLTLERGRAIDGAEGGAIDNGGTLVLNGVTVQDNVVELNGTAEGGAIYNQGTLVLNGATVQGNVAEGVPGEEDTNAAGGGIYSSGGSVTLEGGTIVQNNAAEGSAYGGNASGGGLYAVWGTVTVTNATLNNNTALAGDYEGLSGNLGYAYGGGLYADGATLNLTNATLDANAATLPNDNIYVGGGAYGGGLLVLGGTATLTNCTVQGNSASAAYTNPGEGGGIATEALIYSAYGYEDVVDTTVSLDTATVAQVTGNTASSGAAYDNIFGPYVLTPAAGQPPIVVNAASANPSPVTGTTSTLSVLGDDAAGFASLTYTWAGTSAPSAPPRQPSAATAATPPRTPRPRSTSPALTPSRSPSPTRRA